MANELMVIQAVSNVGQAVTSMATSLKTFKTIRKQDSVVLEEKLRYLRSACRAQGYGELTRLSLDEMDKTLMCIKQKNYSGEMLEISMDMLKMQYHMLSQNIQNYMHR